MQDLINQFELEMLADSQEYTAKTKTNPSRYIQMIGEHGGVATAQMLAIAPKFHEGFTRAWEHGCLNLTAEYLMVFGNNGQYRKLFDDASIKSAARKLKQVGITSPINR